MPKVNENTIKELDQIRKMYTHFFLYSSFIKEKLCAELGIKGRTYDKRLKILKNIVDDEHISENYMLGNNKIIGISYDKYQMMKNPFLSVYKQKAYKNDTTIKRYSNILKILKDSKPLSVNEICEELYKKEKGDSSIKKDTVNKYLRSLEEGGLIKKVGKKYALANDVLSEFDSKELEKIYQAVSFYANVFPLHSQGHFILEHIENRNKSNKLYGNIIFQKIFLSDMLNDEVYLTLSTAIKEKVKVSFVDNETVSVIPVKIFKDDYNRERLLAKKDDRYVSYKLSKIMQLKKTTDTYDNELYCDIVGKSFSMTRIDMVSDLNETVLVEVDFKIFEDKEFYILERLEREKKQGKIQKISNKYWKYSIEVLEPIEMIPWLRSFGEFAKVIQSDKHDLKEKISKNWEEAFGNYGII